MLAKYFKGPWSSTSVGNRYVMLEIPHILVISVSDDSRRKHRHGSISPCLTAGSHKPTVRRKK
jgi:hypothetical protein